MTRCTLGAKPNTTEKSAYYLKDFFPELSAKYDASGYKAGVVRSPNLNGWIEHTIARNHTHMCYASARPEIIDVGDRNKVTLNPYEQTGRPNSLWLFVFIGQLSFHVRTHWLHDHLKIQFLPNPYLNSSRTHIWLKHQFLSQWHQRLTFIRTTLIKLSN